MTDQQQSGTPPTTEPPADPRLPFDEQVCERLRAAFVDVFLRHPEVKCLAASITWNGTLNDANILHGIWLGPDGPVQTPDGVVGSLFQTLKMLDEQAGRGLALVGQIQEQVHVLGTEAVKRHEEIQALEEQIREKRAELQALYGEAAQGPPDGPRQGDP